MRGGAQSIQSAINILFANRALLEDAFSLRCTVVLVRLQPHKCSERGAQVPDPERRRTATLAAVAATHHLLAEAANGG